MSAAVVVQELQAIAMPVQHSHNMAASGMTAMDWEEEERELEMYAPLPDADYMEFYRMYTERLLRSYRRSSMQMGRSGSVLGNLVIRGRASHTGMKSFEDAVIFVHDMDNCLKKLDCDSRDLLSKIMMQEFTQQEVADMRGVSARSVVRRYREALDRLTVILREVNLLEELI